MAFLTDSQKAKIVAAVSPLYSDSEFSNVSDFNVVATQVVPVTPVGETDSVDVTPALPA